MKLLLFLVTWVFGYCHGYKVLIFVPGVSHSHVQFDYLLANVIAEKGHKVTVLLEEYSPLHNKIKLAPGVKEIRFDSLKNVGIDKGNLLSQINEDVYEDKGFFTEIIKIMTMWSSFGNITMAACENLMTDVKLINNLKEEKFDTAIVDLMGFCPFGVIKLLGIPSHIWLSSAILLDTMATIIGAPNHPSYVPNFMSSFSDDMTFFQRFGNFLGFVWSQHNQHQGIQVYNALFRKYYGQDFPSVAYLAAKSSLMFVNSEEFLDFPRPILHKIIYIGGLGLAKPQALEPYWENLVKSSKEGVVLFSFGSIANTTIMPVHWKEAFLAAFAKFPDFTFIWKFEGDLPKEKISKNVVLSKWVPQKDLFGHFKMKAFITHAGFNSLLEASTNGIPIIPIPLFADQYGNARRAEKQGTAISLLKTQISVETVTHALQEILYNSSYKRSAERLSNLIRKKPVKSAQLVVDWVEYVAENEGLPNLEPASVDMNWFEYLSLDILAVISFINCLVLLGIYFVVKICIKHVFAKNKKKVE